MISTMCGMKTITRNQKNTSFGAHEFRDGVSYNEQEQREAIIKKEDIASLRTGECYVLLPEPQVLLSKLQVPIVAMPNKNEALITKETTYITHDKSSEDLAIIEDIESEDDETANPKEYKAECSFSLDT